MFRLQAKTRITLALVSLATTAALIGSRLVPDHREHIKHQRAALCEALAVNTQVALQTQTSSNVRTVLQVCVERNDELLSAGIRDSEGQPIVEVGEHFKNWPSHLGDKSSHGFLQIPIYDGVDDDGKPSERCRMELRFVAVMPVGLVATIVQHPWAKFLIFFGPVCFLVYRWYLGRVFRHLDPQNAAPKRVRSAYDFLAGGLVMMDKNLRIVLVNSAFTNMVGLPRSELLAGDLGGLAWINRSSNDEFPWQVVRKSRSDEIREHLQIASGNGSLRTLLANASPVIGQDGQYRGVLVSFEDITPLETAKAALEQSKDAAEAANVAKSAFLANMSHEIRTPMNAILGFAELMKRGFDVNHEERQEYVEIIHSSGQHLLGLINDILDLSKVESGRMEVEWIDCEPHQLLHEVVSVLKARAQEKQLEIGFSIEGTIPQRIKADPLRLRQILTNLAGNALKFTESGSVQLFAKTSQRQDGTPTMLFEVRDTGIGIPEDKIAAVFDPFSQADESVTRRFGGTGLGLSISRKLAELMGGSVSATSEVGQGSSFFAEIQLQFEAGTPMLAHDQAVEQLKAINDSSNDAVQLPPGRVLVVDDGESNRKLIELLLTRAGVEVECATNGEEAVKAVIGDSFDAVLMDVQMPVMDGYTAMGLIREAGYQIPIVALTAHAMNEERERALSSGFSHFLPKPVDIDDLYSLVAVLLGGEVTRKPPTASEAAQLESFESPQQSSLNEPITCSLPMDDEEFRAICRDFATRLRDELKKFVATLNEGNFAELSNQAHWLKGAGGTAGFDVFTGPAQALEIAAKDNDKETCCQQIASIIQLTKRLVVENEFAKSTS